MCKGMLCPEPKEKKHWLDGCFKFYRWPFENLIEKLKQKNKG